MQTPIATVNATDSPQPQTLEQYITAHPEEFTRLADGSHQWNASQKYSTNGVMSNGSK